MKKTKTINFTAQIYYKWQKNSGRQLILKANYKNKLSFAFT